MSDEQQAPDETICCSCGQQVPRSIIAAVLAKRKSVPAVECFCGIALEAGLCPNGHDPIAPDLAPVAQPPTVISVNGEPDLLLQASTEALVLSFNHGRELRTALQQAAIEAHVGFQHLRKWEECDLSICDDRKRLINRFSEDADSTHDADDAQHHRAFKEFWREQERDRPVDYAHPEHYATFTKRYAPPIAASAQPPSPQSELGPSWEAVEIAEGLTNPAIGKIKIPEWRAMTNEIAAALDAERSRGAELQREVDAQLLCNLCRRPSDYHPAALDPEYGDWRHRRINHEKEWDEVCAAAAIRANKQQ